MNDNVPWHVIELIPTLSVTDLDRAVVYYESLGFKREWSYPSESAPTHVGLSFGPLNLMLNLCDDPSSKIQRQNLYFVIESLADYHHDLEGSLGNDLPDIVESDYGMRDFSIQDPWGHLLTFGESC